jgi:hypothetical protein
MENVKIIDIKNWRLENLPKSLIQEKRELLRSAGENCPYFGQPRVGPT